MSLEVEGRPLASRKQTPKGEKMRQTTALLTAATILAATLIAGVLQRHAETIEGLEAQVAALEVERNDALELALERDEQRASLVEEVVELAGLVQRTQEELSEARREIEAREATHSELLDFLERVNEAGQVRMSRAAKEAWARAVTNAGEEFDIEPRVLLGVAFRESRLGTYNARRAPQPEGDVLHFQDGELRAHVLGDYRNGVWRSCGAFQIQFRYQPETCEELMNVDTGARVAARYLSHLRNTCSAHNYLAAYNGGCRNANITATQRYQSHVRSLATR